MGLPQLFTLFRKRNAVIKVIVLYADEPLHHFSAFCLSPSVMFSNLSTFPTPAADGKACSRRDATTTMLRHALGRCSR